MSTSLMHSQSPGDRRRGGLARGASGRAQGAEPDAIAAWVAHHQRGLWRYLRVLGCDSGRLEDVLQDTFLAAIENGIQHKPQPVATCWLRSTARNLYYGSFRKRRGESLSEDLAAAAACDHYAGRDGSGDGALDALRECIQGLPPRSQDVVQRFYGDGARRDAVAAELSMSVEGIKTLLRRLKDALRSCVEMKKAQWS